MAIAEELADPLISAYGEVWDSLTAELQTLTDPKQWRRRERIRELLVSIDDRITALNPKVRQFTKRELREVYGLGAARTAETLNLAGSFTLQSDEALRALGDTLESRLLLENAQASRVIKREVRSAARIA